MTHFSLQAHPNAWHRFRRLQVSWRTPSTFHLCAVISGGGLLTAYRRMLRTSTRSNTNQSVKKKSLIYRQNAGARWHSGRANPASKAYTCNTHTRARGRGTHASRWGYTADRAEQGDAAAHESSAIAGSEQLTTGALPEAFRSCRYSVYQFCRFSRNIA